jgi:hypothetical protein
MKDTEFEAKRATVLMASAISTALGLLGAAVAARRALEKSQTADRQKLSLRAWIRPLLVFAGNDGSGAKKLRGERERAPHLLQNVGAYAHDIEECVRQDLWRSPGSGGTPTTPHADKRAAEIELSRIGLTLYDAIVVALEDLAERAPSAFGPVDDEAVYNADRQKIADHAAAALEAFRAVPVELQVGLAYKRDVAVDPLGSLSERLVAHAMNPAKASRPPSAQIGAGMTVLSAR